MGKLTQKHGRGRPTALTQKNLEDLERCVKAGLNLSQSARAIDHPKSTVEPYYAQIVERLDIDQSA